MTRRPGSKYAAAPVHVGIAGAGLWSERAHIPAFSRLQDVRIVGIADPDLARATLLAAKAPTASAYQNVEEMMQAGLDAIVIATPEDVHYPIAKSALQAGLHVLCEKPMARTVEQARDLHRLAADAGVVTKIGFVLRYSPAFLQLNEFLRAGFVGKVHSFMFYNNSPQFIDATAQFHWTMDEERTGGGSYVEYGCHGLDLGRWLVGEIAEVCANAIRLIHARPDPVTGNMRQVVVDDVCSWLANFSEGAEGQFHVSWSSLPIFGFQVAVVGDKGALGWRMVRAWPFAEVLGSNAPDADFARLNISDRYKRDAQGAKTWRECFAAGLARRFIDEVRGLKPPEGPDFGDGLMNQIALNAMAQSLRERRWVSLGS
jgi:predicted dehydrogenase